MLSRILKMLLVALLVSSCSAANYGHYVEIPDVSKNQQVVLNLEKSREPYSLRMRLIGQINGNAVCKIVEEKERRNNVDLFKGKINKPINLEWYGRACIIDYVPNNVTAGTLRIYYKYEYVK